MTVPTVGGIVPKFLDPLVLEKLDGRWWRHVEEFRYDSAVLGARIVIPAGRITDLSSVPRLPFAFWLAGDTGHKGGAVHDECYLMHLCSREVADAVFLEALGVEGVEGWRARLMYWGVRWKGEAYW